MFIWGLALGFYLTLLIGWTISEARVFFFFVNPSLIWPCIHRAYFRHVLGTPLIQLLLPIQKKSVKMVAAPINSSILMLG